MTGCSTIGVADHSSLPLPDGGRWGWYDLAALLHTDIPWWSLGLTDRAAMLTWRPGDPPARIQLHNRQCSAAWITRCGRATGEDVFDGIADWLDHEIASAVGIDPLTGHDQTERHPGLVHAAIADMPDGPAIAPTPAEVSAALHQIVDDTKTAANAANSSR